MVTVDILVGLLFIAFYAWGRFNTPPTNRSSTTICRYFLGAGFYSLVPVSLYLILIRWPHLLLLVYQGDQEAVPGWARDLSSPLLVALLLTVLLPKFPVLSGIDEWIRGKVQYMAAIPFEARRLSAELQKSDRAAPDGVQFELPAEVRQRIVQELAEREFEIRDLESPGRLPHLWVKASALLSHLASWEGHQRFSRYTSMFSGDLANLRGRHEQLAPKVRRAFTLARHVPESEPDSERDVAAEYQRDVADQIGDLLRGLYDFISRGVLYCELTQGGRNRQLQALGFDLRWVPSRLPLNALVNALVAVGGTIAVLMMFGFMLRGAGGKSPAQLMLLSLQIASAYVVAIFCAVSLKEEGWAVARWRPGEVRPVAFYLMAGLIAAGVQVAINLLVRYLGSLDLSAAWHAFTRGWPWLLMPFTTAFVTAWLLDNRPDGRLLRLGGRWGEGMAQSLVTMAAFLLVVRGFQVGPQQPWAQFLSLAMAGAVGFTIGACVPTWYREAPRERQPVDDSRMPVAAESLAS